MRWKKSDREFVGFQRVARVATVAPDGTPHNVPVCPLLEGDRIYFGTEGSSKKVRNLRANPRLALTFDEYSEAWGRLSGLMVQGEARILEGGPPFRRVRALLYRRYPQYEPYASLEEGSAVIVEVQPRRVFRWGL